MGLFDDMAGKAVSSALGSSSNPLAHQLLQMINDHPGGLSGLVQNFQQKGLGDLVNSWVGTGQNLSISADQVHSVLGSGVVQQLAAKPAFRPTPQPLRLRNSCPRSWTSSLQTVSSRSRATCSRWGLSC